LSLNSEGKSCMCDVQLCFSASSRRKGFRRKGPWLHMSSLPRLSGFKKINRLAAPLACSLIPVRITR
jgi:hypothetical protein